MASRFWVGGTGTWDGVTTTNWSATSGGAGGASVPGTADTVTFDANSGGGTILLATSPTVQSVTGGAHTGTFNTAGFNITCNGGNFSYSGTGVRTLTLSTSTITLSTNGGLFDITTTTNLTLSAASATVHMNNGNQTFSGGGGSYGTLTADMSNSGDFTVSGANTFVTFTFAPTNSTSTIRLKLNNSFTVTGTFTGNGFNASNVGQILSNTVGTAMTITAAVVSISNMVFCDIIGAGAGTWSGSVIGDRSGNSGITFTAAVSRFWVGNGGSFNDTTHWSTSSGGATGARVPLPQDTAVFDANSITSATQTILMNVDCYPTLDFTSVLNSPNITFTLVNVNQFYVNGDLKFPATMGTITATSVVFLTGRGAQTITSGGNTINGNVSIVSGGGTYSVSDSFTLSTTSVFSVVNGTFTDNGKTISTGFFNSSNSNIRTVTMGNCTWFLTGGNSATSVWTTSTSTNLTLNSLSTTIINCNYSGSLGTRTFQLGTDPTFAGTVKITAGTDIFGLSHNTGGSVFTHIDFTGFKGSTATGSGTSAVFIGNITFDPGMTCPADATHTWVMQSTTGITQTWKSNGVTFGLDLQINITGGGTFQPLDNLALGSTQTLTITQGIFDGATNNVNVTAGIITGNAASQKTLLGGTATWTATGTGNVISLGGTGFAGFVLQNTTFKITDTSAASKTFASNTMTFGPLIITGGGTGAIILAANSRAFTSIQVTGTGPAAITFTASTTTTLSTFTASGSSGNLVTLASSAPGTTYNIALASPQEITFANIKDCVATLATLYAGHNSTNGGNNTNVVFGDFFSGAYTETYTLTETFLAQLGRVFAETFSLVETFFKQTSLPLGEGFGFTDTEYAVQLSSTNQSYMLASNPPILPQNSAISLFCRFMITTTTGSDICIKAYGSNSGGRGGSFIYTSASPHINFVMVDSGGTSFNCNSANNSIALNTWYDALGTWDPVTGLQTLYLNNAQVQQVAGPATTSTGSESFSYGTEQDTATPSYMDVAIACCGVWNRAMAAAEAISVSPLNMPLNGLKMRHIFQENGSTAPKDYSGNGHTISFFNTPAWIISKRSGSLLGFFFTVGRALNDTFTLTDSLKRAAIRTFADTVSLTDSLIRRAGKAFNDAVAATENTYGVLFGGTTISWNRNYDFVANLPHSYAIWFNMSFTPTSNVGFFYPGGDRLDANFEGTTGKLFVYRYSSDGNQGVVYKDATNNKYIDGNWHLLVVVKDNANINVYVDSVNVGTLANALGANSNASQAYFGPNNSFGAGIQLAKPRQWKRALTSTEISNQFTNPGLSPKDSMLAEFTLNGPSLIDTSGNGIVTPLAAGASYVLITLPNYLVNGFLISVLGVLRDTFVIAESFSYLAGRVFADALSLTDSFIARLTALSKKAFGILTTKNSSTPLTSNNEDTPVL